MTVCQQCQHEINEASLLCHSNTCDCDCQATFGFDNFEPDNEFENFDDIIEGV